MQTNYPKVAFNAINTKGKTITSGKTIKTSGCAPTSLGNVMRALGISSATTKDICGWCREASYTKSNGQKAMVRHSTGVSTTQMVILASKKWNFNYSIYNISKSGNSKSAGFDKALAWVKEGNMGLISLKGYPFSSGGHTVALVGYKGNKIAIWDSYYSAHKSNYKKAGIETGKVDGLIYVSKEQIKNAIIHYIFISKK